MKYLLPCILLIPSLSAGQQEPPFRVESITATIHEFSPKDHIIRFKINYTDSRAVINARREIKELKVINFKGSSLKAPSFSISKCSYELDTGKGTFTLSLFLKDMPFSKDDKLRIKGNLTLTCARLASLPIQEMSLQKNSSYSIPLCIPPFIKEDQDVAELSAIPSVMVYVYKMEKPNVWPVGLTHPLNFPYAGMEFFDREGRKIPATVEPAGCRSGPPTFTPYVCTFSKPCDQVLLKIQYAEKRENGSMPLNFTVGRDGSIKAALQSRKNQ